MGMARVAQYTENVSFLASQDMKTRIETAADAYQVSAGAVWRRAVEIGMDAAIAEFAAKWETAAVLAASTGTVDFSG